MKTKIVPLIGDPIENFYQLGLGERESFFKIESRIKNLLSTNPILKFGQELLLRARVLIHKKEDSLFAKCIHSYSQGLGIDPARYYTFISLFELAAHYGQSYPELKGILPGCTSLFVKNNNEFTHSRLLDFPLIGFFDEAPRLYYWQTEGKSPLLIFGTEGMAPLFLQGLHGDGISFAIHHKPGKQYFNEGESIFQIIFESLFQANHFIELKKELKKKSSMTKWSVLLLEKLGQVHVLDIEGPAQDVESFNLNETSPLIFTNIPLKTDHDGFESYLRFSENRQDWIKQKIQTNKDTHLLDAMTQIEDQKTKNWIHPTATLSTVAAWHINLTKGFVDIKEGESALTSSDKTLRVNLSHQNDITVLKKEEPLKPIEIAWKKAATAQSSFDQGNYDLAYHELQMAESIMPHPVWKQIFNFYLCVWDFKFITNDSELSLVYKKLKSLHLPSLLKDQWLLQVMRMEKKLDLSPTVFYTEVSKTNQNLFQKEKLAARPVFSTWMKLVYPRIEVLDIFSPHDR